MADKQNPPSIRKQAFDCPFCGAFTTQYWYTAFAKQNEDNATPNKPTPDIVAALKEAKDIPDEKKAELLDWCTKLDAGLIFLDKRDTQYDVFVAQNLYLSKCYHCKKIAVWVNDKLLFPANKIGVSPNPDMPEEIMFDFEEARSILNDSPRGAAALLRLCVQKLCIHLGGKGNKLDNDIADLVSKGLNPLVQKSLDIVRVIGNEAVHPGTIDLRDDRDTAAKLLGIINSIVEQMISHPKSVQETYDSLPESKRKAIEDRDKKTTPK